jgi:hypothetical protein
MTLNDNVGSCIEGFVKIWCPKTGKIFLNKRNAIHAENLSQSITQCITNNSGYISEMHFGNGGTTTDAIGNIIYRNTNTSGSGSDLYAPTHYKVVEQNENNNDVNNKIEFSHTADTNYSDIIITATIAINEPVVNESYSFDELGLKSKGDSQGTGLLLSHVIFHPITKNSTNEVQVVYTIRFRIGL